MILGLCLVSDRDVDDRRIAQSFIKALPHSPSLILGLKYFGSGRFDETGLERPAQKRHRKKEFGK
jgi:hypothetical protein